MKRHKIAFLISHPVQYFSPLFAELAKTPGIDLTVLYCSDEGAKEMADPGFDMPIKWDTPLLEGYNYKILNNHSPFPAVSNAPFGLINFGVAGEIFKNRYDAIIIHGWHYATFWLAYISALISRTPVLLHSENPRNQEILKPAWKIFLKRISLGALFKCTAGFLAIGTENRRFYEFYGVKNEKIFPAPYAVDNDSFIKKYRDCSGKKGELKKELGISPDKTVILFSGKLVDKKRPFDLLSAYKKIGGEDKALVFMGDGKLKAAMERYAIENALKDVYFAGFINQSDIYRYYAAADIFVLPSTVGETWGLAVNEAMCFALPVVVSDLAGCGADLVASGRNGYIFKTGDVTALAECIGRLLRDADLRASMARASLQKIRRWSYKEDIDSISGALNKLIQD